MKLTSLIVAGVCCGEVLGVGFVHIPDSVTTREIARNMCDALIAPASTNTEKEAWGENINPGTGKPFLTDEEKQWVAPIIEEIAEVVADRASTNAVQKIERLAQNKQGGGLKLRPSDATREQRNSNNDTVYEISSTVFQANRVQKEVPGITVSGKNSFDVYIKYNPRTDRAVMTTEALSDGEEVTYKIYHVEGNRVEDYRSVPTVMIYQ